MTARYTHPIMRTALLLACLLLCSAPAVAQVQNGSEQQRLAALAEQISKEVERLRGWEFEGPVKTDIVQRDQISRKLIEEMAEEYPEERLRADEAFLKTIGALPRRVDAKAELLDVMTAQIGGYYDPKDKTFYIVADVARRYGPLPLAVVIAHELTHALDDQRLDLKKLIDSAEMDEDRSFAAAAVVEGSATVLMNRYLIAELEKKGSATFGLVLFSAVSLLQEREAMEKLARSPRYFHTMIARYTAGEAFLRYGALRSDGDSEGARHTEALLRAAEDLPQSSEQILHPAKYWDSEERDHPVVVDSASAKALLQEAGLRAVHEQTAGELLCALVTQGQVDLAQALAASGQWTNAAATGWGGDRFFLVESEAAPEGSPEQRGVWFTFWDTPEDREEFLAAYGVAAERIMLGDRGAVLLLGLDAAVREKVTKLVRKTPPKLMRNGEPWTFEIDQ